MTWTQIKPEFSQYEGMTPSEIGRAIMNERTYNLFIFKEQKKALDCVEGHAWEWVRDDDEWIQFWKPVYDLENKDVDMWTEDEHFAYRALLNIGRGVTHKVS
jgi:hypothetical protein